MIRRVLIASVVALSAGMAQAGTLSLVTVRSNIGENDHVSWGNAAPPGGFVANPFSVGSYGGINVTVSQPGADSFSVTQQVEGGTSVPDTGFGGNFAVGDYVLSSASGRGSGSLRLAFANPVSAAGAQVASFFPGAYTAKIEVFNAAGSKLATFTEDGFEANTGDNSAIFLGVSDTEQEIASIRYSLIVGPTFAQTISINQLSLASTFSVPGTNPDLNPDPITEGPPPGVPEPSSLAMASIAFLVLLGRWAKIRLA
jgi:hypothetical protein